MTFSFYESDETEKKVVNTKEEKLVTESVTFNADVRAVVDKAIRMISTESDRLSKGSKSTSKFEFMKAIVASINTAIKSELTRDIKVKNDQRTKQKAAEAAPQNQQKTA